MAESREHRQDHALVLLLQALPGQRLEAILLDLGIEPEKIAEAPGRRDKRACTVCGLGYIRCRALDEKAPYDEQHEWSAP